MSADATVRAHAILSRIPLPDGPLTETPCTFSDKECETHKHIKPWLQSFTTHLQGQENKIRERAAQILIQDVIQRRHEKDMQQNQHVHEKLYQKLRMTYTYLTVGLCQPMYAIRDLTNCTTVISPTEDDIEDRFDELMAPVANIMNRLPGCYEEFKELCAHKIASMQDWRIEKLDEREDLYEEHREEMKKRQKDHENEIARMERQCNREIGVVWGDMSVFPFLLSPGEGVAIREERWDDLGEDYPRKHQMQVLREKYKKEGAEVQEKAIDFRARHWDLMKELEFSHERSMGLININDREILRVQDLLGETLWQGPLTVWEPPRTTEEAREEASIPLLEAMEEASRGWGTETREGASLTREEASLIREFIWHYDEHTRSSS